MRPEKTNHQESVIQESTIKEYLISAALQKLEMVYYFIEAEGLHPDATREGKPTALCYAAMKRNTQLLNYLIEKGADVNHRDVLGMTPLHYAVLGGCNCTMAKLIAEGAMLNRMNHAGDTPLAIAMRCEQRSHCREFLQRYGAALAAVPASAKRFH